MYKRQVKKVTGNAYLDFPVGKSAIQPDFRNNAAELAKIRGTLDSLIQAKNVRVRGITLVGYASPEGSTQLNDRLSAERADALKAYLLQNYKNCLLYTSQWRFCRKSWRLFPLAGKDPFAFPVCLCPVFPLRVLIGLGMWVPHVCSSCGNR